MLSTVRETIASLRDKSYGNIIISKRIWLVIWYWTKYLLIFTIVPWVIIVFLFTYYLPQLPRALRDHLPDASVSLSHGRFSTTLPQPLRIGDPDFMFIVDTSATSAAVLTGYRSGLVVASSGAYLKTADGTSDYAAYPSDLNFSTNQSQIISWVTSHRVQLWWLGFAFLTLAGSLFSGFYWLYNLISFAVTGFIFWLLARILHRRLDYRGAVKIAIYAAVLPFVLGALFSVSSHPVLSLVNLVVFFYFGYNWIRNLPELP